MLQVALISIAAVVGVFMASALLEGVLIRAALDDEVVHFWRQRDADPAFQLPNTRNLRGYFEEARRRSCAPCRWATRTGPATAWNSWST
jgi:hypothetical protein